MHLRASQLLTVLLAVAPLAAPAGTVRTLDGRTIDGDVRFDPKGMVVVTPPGGQPVEVEIENLLHVTFGPSAPAPSARPDASAGLLGIYFETKDLSGASVTRIDPVVQFNWQKGQPIAGIEGDAFSVRWIGKVAAPETGDYTFITRTNDGARLWVDNRLLFDHFVPPESLKEWSGAIRLEKGRKVDLRLEYQEQGGNAEAHLLWKGPGIPNPEIIAAKYLTPAPPPPPTAAAALPGKPLGNGLLAIYYATKDLSGHAVTRIDPKIDFSWGGNGPAPGIGPDNFSVRWIGQIRAPRTEQFTFHPVTDDGVRLWINNQLIVDQWQDQSASESSGAFPLKEGQTVDVRMEYYDGSGEAVAQLSWSSPSVPKQIIPTQALIPASSGAKLATRPAPATRLRPIQGLVLRSGTLLKAQVERADDSVVRYHRDRERDLSVSISQVACIFPHPPQSGLSARIPPGRSGVLLRTGDFFEGDIRYIRDGRVRISSVLFGLKDFGYWDCQAIVYHDPTPLPAPYEIRVADGSHLLASSFSAGKEFLVVKDVSAGPLKVWAGEVLEIRCGGSRFQPLAETRLVKADLPPGMTFADAVSVDALSGDVTMWMDSQPVDRGLAVAAGTSLEYALLGAYRVFHARAGAADHAPAGLRLRLVVLVDGQEACRSPDRAAGEGAVDVTAGVEGAKTLTLRVEAVGASDPRLISVWANPVLVRPGPLPLPTPVKSP